MIKYQNWYIAIWTVVILLYNFHWSSLNLNLDLGLAVFFLCSFVLMLISSVTQSKIKPQRLVFLKKRSHFCIVLIGLGFLADWMYSGGFPFLNQYQGFDPEHKTDVSVGIPYFHVLLISFAIFYTMYTAYLLASDARNKNILIDFVVLIFLFFINSSRGYITFCIGIYIFSCLCFSGNQIRRMKAKIIPIVTFSIILIVEFISAMGNVRSGVAWNDCSYIQRIAYLWNYPDWISNHFMWTYSYLTSPLANLNYCFKSFNGVINFTGSLLCFLPEQFSGSFVSTIPFQYIVNHLNAVSGFASFVCTSGVWGLFMWLIVTFFYFSLIKLFLKKMSVLFTFGNIMLCFLICSTVFFNFYYTSALCYIPFYLLLFSFILKKKEGKGELMLINVE